MNINLLKPNRRTNDEERQMWVENDESLYNHWLSSRKSMREYIFAKMKKSAERLGIKTG